MNPSDDFDLLDEYVATGSHAAFDLLVKRHAGWIYAAALRRVRSADMADDVTQAAFIVLAQKASSISRRESLTAWLYRVVQYAAIDALRRRGTRQHHERLAARPEAAAPFDEKQDVIENLDAALDSLGRREREAIILRFFDDRTLEQIGHVQRVAASTVQRRLERSLNRIGSFLRRKGIVAMPSTLGGTLVAIGKLQAPPMATAKLTAMATAAGALPASTTGPIGLAHGAMKAMTMMKLKIAAAGLVAFTLLGTGGAIATHYAMAEAGDHSTPQPSAIARPSTGPVGAPIPLPAAVADADTKFVKQFKANWQTITLNITNVNPANRGTNGQSDSQSLTIQGTVDILDTTHVLGFDRMNNFIATRILDDAGNDITAATATNPAGTPWYAPLRYTQNFNKATNQFGDVLAPQQFQIALKAGLQSPNRLRRVEGYLLVLTCQSTRQVDVPFVSKGKPVQVTPGASVYFNSARQDGSNYSYQMAVDAKKQGGFLGLGGSPVGRFTGLLQRGESLPSEMVTGQYWIDANGNDIETMSRHSPEFVGVGASNGSGGLGGAGKIAAMRFEIAEGLAERKLPIVLENIDVPHK